MTGENNVIWLFHWVISGNRKTVFQYWKFVHWESILMLRCSSFLGFPSLASSSVHSRHQLPLKFSLLRCDQVFFSLRIVLGVKMHLAAQENPSLLLLSALHLANVFCWKNAENFPFHHVRSSGLDWPFPKSPVDTAGAGWGTGKLLSWERWPSLGLKATAEQGWPSPIGWGEAPSLVHKWKDVGYREVYVCDLSCNPEITTCELPCRTWLLG